jgi:hypothetical protein
MVVKVQQEAWSRYQAAKVRLGQATEILVRLQVEQKRLESMMGRGLTSDETKKAKADLAEIKREKAESTKEMRDAVQALDDAVLNVAETSKSDG